MKKSFDRIRAGYKEFRSKFTQGDHSVMQYLARNGQQPQVMVIACCDSRVDPALILQAQPGELFVARNVANIVPPYEKDGAHHGTSAALEFAVCYLEVKHLILFGHSQCGGIEALLSGKALEQDDFITNWVSLVQPGDNQMHTNDYAKSMLHASHKNCMTFPWLKQRVEQGELIIHEWFFDIQSGEIEKYEATVGSFIPLNPDAE